MISSSNRKVFIYITTYKSDHYDTRDTKKAMERKHDHDHNDKRFLCSICLNKNSHNNDCGKKNSKACPICRKHYICDHIDKRHEDFKQNHKDTTISLDKEIRRSAKDPNTKNVQTSQTDLTQDLSLLKEVLTVFQSKKQLDIKTNSKIVMKDVSVETESKSRIDLKANLTKSRIFQFSIEDGIKNNGNNFKIVNYSQPYNAIASQYSIDLIKHKSSSIPQMKLEELKYSLKEKTKSKDAIEEVNRMFATVRKRELSNLEEHNRPLIRNGPRVLPVVKTKTYHDADKKDYTDCEASNDVKKLPVTKTKPYNKEDNENSICKCCQSNNMHLSGGDSFFKHECCYHKMLCEGRCEKCVYMLCCHYQKHNKTETGALMCECCKSNTNEKIDEGCDGNHCDHF